MKLKAVFLFFMLIISIRVKAQVTDDFSDGDFINNPAWTGNANLFMVNTSGNLQLNAGGAATGSLVFVRSQQSVQGSEWTFNLQVMFSPSSQNYVRYYLVSDQQDPILANDAIYLQFGESGSNDAIELFHKSGSSLQSLGRGVNGSIAGSFNLSVKVTCDNNDEWSVWTSTTPGSFFLIPDFTATHTVSNAGQYCGISCTVTSGNATGVLLDDIYEGVIRYDVTPPQIIAVTAIDPDTVLVQCNEAVLPAASQIQVDGIQSPTVLPDPVDARLFRIVTPVPLVSGMHVLVLSMLQDIYGNALVADTIMFQYILARFPLPGELIFTEVMADPGGAAGLPEAEYVEIYNRSTSYLLLSGVSISDGSSSGTLPDDTLAPLSYYCISSASGAVLLQQSGYNAHAVSGFPSVNNDADNLSIINADGVVTDHLNFNDKLYHNNIKAQGGWSVERIDNDFLCEADNNWTASKDADGGTPGFINTVSGKYYDNQAPYLRYASVLNDSSIAVIISEPIDSSNLNASTDVIISTAGKAESVSDLKVHSDSIIVTLNDALKHNAVYNISFSHDVTDCAGNPISHNESLRTGMGQQPQKGDVVINEILYNPINGDNDYIELYNNGTKLISVDSIQLSSVNEEGTFNDPVHLNFKGRVVCPGDYLCLTTDRQALLNKSSKYNRQNIESLSIPSMSDDEGHIVLLNHSLEVVDDLSYDDSWQYPLLASTEGVALERINASNATQDGNNWHSASETSGSGTPGSRNSQASRPVEGEMLQLSSPWFSPDNDGVEDVLTLKYNSDNPGDVLSLVIYNAWGKEIIKLAEQQLTENGYEYHWNGCDEAGNMQPAGNYVVLWKVYNVNGHIDSGKTTVALLKIIALSHE